MKLEIPFGRVPSGGRGGAGRVRKRNLPSSRASNKERGKRRGSQAECFARHSKTFQLGVDEKNLGFGTPKRNVVMSRMEMASSSSIQYGALAKERRRVFEKFAKTRETPSTEAEARRAEGVQVKVSRGIRSQARTLLLERNQWLALWVAGTQSGHCEGKACSDQSMTVSSIALCDGVGRGFYI